MSEFRKLKYGNAVCVLVWSCIRMLGDALTMRLKSRTVIEAVRAGPTDQSVKSHLPQRQLLQAFCSVVICRKWPIAEEQCALVKEKRAERVFTFFFLHSVAESFNPS